MTCARSISFTIPGNSKSPGVLVTATEHEGKLDFTLALAGPDGSTGDLRGLFFDLADDSKLAGLSHSGSALVTDFDTVDVLDLGNGANMNGAASPFDVGLEFGSQGNGKNAVQSVSFTLSNSANNLTLDDIAHMDFGARLAGGSGKLVTVAPAAPDAHDDSYSVFEDGQAGLASPSHTPAGLLLQVLGNDSDADGQALSISHVEGALHGAVQIVDGDDADDLAGDAILYTPDADFAGTETLDYCISDGHGGVDGASVSLAIAAVADRPLLDVQMLEGDSVNQIRFIVTATPTDADGSETIDRIEALGLPAGATLTPSGANPGAQPGQLVQEFVLTLPEGQDSKFDLSFQAIAKETSNGDEQSALSQSFKIEIDHRHQQAEQRFDTLDQSMWGSGAATDIHSDDFYGLDEHAALHSDPGDTLVYDFSAGYTLGFRQQIDIEGGDIDASLTYDVTLDATHNKTLDTLLIKTDAELVGGSFDTSGPQAAYQLDFKALLSLYAYAGVNIGDVLEIPLTVPPVDIKLDGSTNIIDFDTHDLAFDVDSMGLQAHMSWPELLADGSVKSLADGQFAGTAEAQFLNMNFDVDQFLLGGNDAMKLGLDLGVVWGSLDLIDFDIFGGASIQQKFLMDEQQLTGVLHFEDGSSQTFQMGEDIKIANASQIDLHGDADGTVEYQLELVPTVSLSNRTDLLVDLDFSYDILKLAGGYDVGFDSGSLNETAYHLGGALVNTAINLHDETSSLHFDSEMVVFG